MTTPLAACGSNRCRVARSKLLVETSTPPSGSGMRWEVFLCAVFCNPRNGDAQVTFERQLDIFWAKRAVNGTNVSSNHISFYPQALPVRPNGATYCAIMEKPITSLLIAAALVLFVAVMVYAVHAIIRDCGLAAVFLDPSVEVRWLFGSCK